ncbi:MAG: MFS transporter [Candidatus Heimdallarchaeaceae archaeon]|jgi:MFS family permease
MSSRFATRFSDYIPPANLMPLLVANMFDALAISSYWIFLSIWLNEEIITPEAGFNYPYLMLAVVLSIPAFISILGSSLLSSFSDKIGRRKEIMFFVRILLMVQCILLIFFNNSALQILLILATFSFHNVFYILHNALSTTICHPDKRGQVSSFQLFFASLGWMIGSSVSGVIYTNLGMVGSLSFGAGFAILTGITVLFSPSKPKEDYDEDSEVESTVQADYDESNNPTVTEVKLKRTVKKERNYWQILTSRSIIILLVTLAVLDFGTGPFNAMSSVYLKGVGLPNNFIALSNTIATFIGMIFQIFVGVILDRKGRRPVLLVAMLAYPILFTLIFVLSNYWIAVFILYCYPLYALRNPTANAIMSDLTNTKERARGMSLLSFQNTIFLYLGSYLGAFIADISSQGLYIFPVFPIAFGAVALVLVFFFIKETNAKLLKPYENTVKLLAE